MLCHRTFGLHLTSNSSLGLIPEFQAVALPEQPGIILTSQGKWSSFHSGHTTSRIIWVGGRLECGRMRQGSKMEDISNGF
jgi:hypothetical protein